VVVNSNFKIRNAGPAASVDGIVIADFRGDPQLAANFSQRVVTIDYRVGGVDDEGTTNGMARLEVYFCGQFASEPRCKNAH
jgi:hypothetical protein